GVLSDKMWPEEGIIAGSATATFEAKAYLIRLVQDPEILGAWQAQESVGTTVHVDDMGLFSWSTLIEDCVTNMVELATRMYQGLEKLNLSLALQK
ncbi:unnamed protein product, partial [Prorocentrum cordatum]